MANRFKVVVEGKEEKAYPFKGSMLSVGTIYEGNPDTLESYGTFFLRTYDGLVCLDNPQHTWTSQNLSQSGFIHTFRMLPAGTTISLKVHK